MILYPAIDIRDGHAVRLVQGDYDRETVYDNDPVEAAQRWADAGARALHVVDLDGARSGAPANLDQLERICAAVSIPVQFGGGLRNSKQAEDAISAGAEWIVLGTAAIDDPELVGAIAEAHVERVVVSVDARQGFVAGEGWTRPGTQTPVEVIERISAAGVSRFVYTPVEVDGLMEGPGLDGLEAVAAAVPGELLYSGGVGTLEDLHTLAGLDLASLKGVIVGRALYERRFTLAEAQAALLAS